MKYLFIFALIFFIFSTSAEQIIKQKSNNKSGMIKDKVDLKNDQFSNRMWVKPTFILVDTSMIAIFKYDSYLHLFFMNCKQADLNNTDLKQIDSLLAVSISKYNFEQEKQYHELKKKNPNKEKNAFLLVLANYKRQYVAVTNNKGEKEVWINCFCNPNLLNWKNELVFVKDGGNCFFNLKINLTTKTFYDFSVNGDA